MVMETIDIRSGHYYAEDVSKGFVQEGKLIFLLAETGWLGMT